MYHPSGIQFLPLIIIIKLYLNRRLFTLMCSLIQSLNKLGYDLPIEMFLDSGKLKKLNEILPDLKDSGHRVLIFSQFLSVLDLLEIYMEHCGHSYLRLDGSTQVQERYGKNSILKNRQYFVYLVVDVQTIDDRLV